jgi:hypothetical protein
VLLRRDVKLASVEVGRAHGTRWIPSRCQHRDRDNCAQI